MGKDETIIDFRMPYSDDYILTKARSEGVMPDGFVRLVVPTVQFAVTNAVVLRGHLANETADAIEKAWEAKHFDQVRWAAYLLQKAATASRPDQTTCVIGFLEGRLLRAATFLGMPNSGEMCKGAAIIACRLQRVHLWPTLPETDCHQGWKVGIHRDFRFPGEKPPRFSLVSSMEFYRKRR